MEIPLKGSTQDVSIIKILTFLSRSRSTGTLSVVTPVFTKRVYFDQGDVIFSASTYEDDRLGEMLLKAGKITVEQYDTSVEILKTTKKRQGAILVECGFLTPKDLFWGLKYQVREIVYSLFQMEPAEYEFMEGELPAQEVISLRMSLGNLIYEGVKRIDNWTRIRNEMLDTDSVLKLSQDPLNLFQDIELNPQDRKILSLVDGRKTIKEVIESSWMGSFEALKILYVLWSTGIVEQATSIPTSAAAKQPERAAEETVSLNDIFQPVTEEEETLLKRIESLYPRLEGLTLLELLETDEKADNETIKKNYYRLAKEFHPDRYYSFNDPSVKTRLTAVFDAITKAYHALKDDGKRRQYILSLSSPGNKENAGDEKARAEEQFKMGVAEFKKGNYWGAADHFKWSSNLAPQHGNYWNYLSLVYSKIPGKLKEAEEALLTAIKLEPVNADYYANLGLVYIKAGLKKRAQSNFQKALKIDAKNVKAIKGLDQSKE